MVQVTTEERHALRKRIDEVNRAGIVETLERFNQRCNDLQDQLNVAMGEIRRLGEELRQVKAEKMADLVKAYGSGPTARV